MIFAATELMSGAAPGSYFSGSSLLVDGQPVEPPTCTQEVFGVLATTPRTGSAVGFVILATSPNDVKPRMHVVDWRIAEINEALTVEWLSAVYGRVLELAQELHPLSRPCRILLEMDDFGQAAFELCQWHLDQTGNAINLHQIRRWGGEPIPTLDQRVEACRARINSGAVTIARPAFERQVPFRSSNTNHFLSQVLAFRPEARDTPVELVTALCTGVGLWSGDGTAG
jgi:hypothetical protein